MKIYKNQIIPIILVMLLGLYGIVMTKKVIELEKAATTIVYTR